MPPSANITVKDFNIVTIEDIGPIDETLTLQLEDSSKPVNNVKDVRVKGIDKFDTYSICFKSKRQGKIKGDEDDGEMGECIHCSTMQAISVEQTGVTATLCIQPPNGRVIKLRAFDHVLRHRRSQWLYYTKVTFKSPTIHSPT